MSPIAKFKIKMPQNVIKKHNTIIILLIVTGTGTVWYRSVLQIQIPSSLHRHVLNWYDF